MLIMPPYSVSSSQQPIFKIIPVGRTSNTGAIDVHGKATFIQAAYLIVSFEVLKTSGIYDLVETDNTVDTNYTQTEKSAVSIKGITDEMSVMTCNIESGSYKAHQTEKTLDCSGSRQITAHAFMGEKRFENEIDVNPELLARLQTTSDNHIAIDVTYI